jgi:hypothetical protein
MKTKNRLLTFSLFVGGIAFWLGEGLFSLLGQILSGKAWIISQTICLPLIVLALLLFIAKKFKPKDIIMNAFSMVFGIWALSPFYMYVMSIFSEKGIMELKGLGWLLIAFPMSAVMASTYSGGLFALITVSVILPIAGIIITRKVESSNNQLKPDAHKTRAS